MLERERRRCLGAEVVRRHRPGECFHAGMGERCELERGEVAVAHPALARSRKRTEVETVEKP